MCAFSFQTQLNNEPKVFPCVGGTFSFDIYTYVDSVCWTIFVYIPNNTTETRFRSYGRGFDFYTDTLQELVSKLKSVGIIEMLDK